MKFRPLEEKDFPLLLKWLQRPHVMQWWNDGDDTLEKVRQHYSSDRDTVKRYILLSEQDSMPIGYFQYYVTASGIGIDQFIAEESLLGRGLGTRAIGMFLNSVVKSQNPLKIVVDPSPNNRRAIRCYEKAGFRHTHTTADADGNLIYMMEYQDGNSPPE